MDGRDFSWALKALGEGCKVSRKAWEENDNLQLKDGKLIIFQENDPLKDGTPVFDMSEWEPTSEDILAEDWLMVEV